jgi:hypothetical protein
VLLALSAMAIVLASAAGATAAPKWSDGVIANDVLNINCVSSIFNPPGYLENEIAVYTGQYIDDDVANLSPVPGEVFDVHVVVGTVGNNCAGTAPRIEIALPPGVEPAVSQANAIRCYFSPDFTNWNQITQAQGCPASVGTGVTSHPSISTWYGLNPDSGYGSPLWLLAQGTAIEIQVPVVADRQMIGIGDPGGCVCVVASVSTLNGESRPDNFFTWSSGFPSSGAYQHLFVFPPKKSPEPDKLGVKVRVPKQSLRRITRRGQIAATCTTTRNGSCGTVATVSRADARRLGLKMLKKPGRVKVGTGASEATKAGKAVAVPVRIAANAKGPLRRSKRPVRIQITATAKSPGTSTATARTVLTARP